MCLLSENLLPCDLDFIDVSHYGVFVLIVISEIAILALSYKDVFDWGDVALSLLLTRPFWELFGLSHRLLDILLGRELLD